jgi:hypothetical protein
MKAVWIANREKELQVLKLKIEQTTERLNRLTDVYLEGALEREMFEERKRGLIGERRALQDRRADYEANRASVPDELKRFVELAGSANSLYQAASIAKRRRLLRTLMSNCTIQQKKVEFTWQIPFRQIADREKDTDGAPSTEIGRTSALLLDQLFSFFAERPEIDFSIMDA